MKNKQLKILSVLGAPFLMIDMFAGGYLPFLSPTCFTGVTGLLYISGWLASMEGLCRIHNTGTRDFTSVIIRMVMVTLLIANLSNVWQICSGTKNTLFYVLDMGWPVSNVLMLLVGTAIIKNGKIPGWQKWIPVAMGCWFPFCVLMGRGDAAFYIGGIYSAVVWFLFAISIARIGEKQDQFSRKIEV